jgi:preprotein translocase subunit SecE
MTQGVVGMQWWKRLKTFLSEVLVETKKVTWPTKQEVINTTTVVVIASFIFGVYLYMCDLVFVFMTQKIFKFFGVFS